MQPPTRSTSKRRRTSRQWTSTSGRQGVTVYPELAPGISALAVFWGSAVLLGVALVVGGSRRHGWKTGRVIAATAGLALLFFLGTKAMYIAENPLALWSRSWRDLLLRGFRDPGGLLVAAIGAPLILWVLGLPRLAFFDHVAPIVALSSAVARVGCLLHGCCFGGPTSVPWAVRYPAASRALMSQVALGAVAPSARASLPVHPLPLYFAIAGVIMFLALKWWEPYRSYDGQSALLLVAMWGAAKAAIEPFRGWSAFDAPTVGGAIGVGVGVLAAGLLVGLEFARHRPGVHNRR